jgi:hypothetical protein
MSVDLTAAVQTWESARVAARQRFDEACGELDGILARPIRAGLPDANAWGRAVENASRRLGELRRAVEDAWTPLERAFAASREAVAGDPQQLRRLRYKEAEQRRQRDQLVLFIGREGRILLAARQSDAARAFYALASAEWSTSRPCGRCGGAVQVGAVAESTDFSCSSCGHVAAFGPGPATTHYLSALDGLADEQSLEAWVALHEARRTFDGYAHPTEADFEVLTTATRGWLDEWTQARRRHHPLVTEEQRVGDRDRRVAAELRSVSGGTLEVERRRMGLAMRHAAAGDMGAILALAESERVDAGGLVRRISACLHEHGNRDAAWQTLALLHHIQGVTDERTAWMQAQLMSLDDDLRTR